MTPRPLAVLCLTLLIALSCNRTSQLAVPPPPATVDRQTLDETVIEAALIDLATGSDPDADTLRREQGKNQILFSSKCQDRVGTLRQELSGTEQWKSINSGDRKAIQEAAADALNRVEAEQCFAAFTPKDPHVLLFDDAAASTRPNQFLPRGNSPPIHAAPPGYADQRRLAVVTFGFAWSRHGGDATYVLRYDGQTWRVIARHFAYYL